MALHVSGLTPTNSVPPVETSQFPPLSNPEVNVQSEAPKDPTSEFVKTGCKFLLRLIDDFRSAFFEETASTKFIQNKINTFIELNQFDLFSPLIESKGSPNIRHEKFFLKHTFEAITHFLNDFSVAWEASQNIETPGKSNEFKILDEFVHIDIPTIIDDQAFFNAFLKQRKENDRQEPFLDENTANIKLSEVLLPLSRGLFCIIDDENPLLNEIGACFACPFFLIVLDYISKPENVSFFLDRIMQSITPSSQKMPSSSSDNCEQVYIDLQQLNELNGYMKSLLLSIIRLMDLNPYVKNLLGYGVDIASHRICTGLLSEIGKKKSPTVSLSLFEFLEKLLYSNEKGKLKNVFLETKPEEKKEAIKNLESKFEKFLLLFINEYTPQLLSKIVFDSAISLKVHSRLFYIIKNPLLLKLLLYDILKANCHSLAEIYKSQSKTIIYKRVEKVELANLIQEEYESHQTNSAEDSTEENDDEDPDIVFIRPLPHYINPKPTFFEEVREKTLRIVSSLLNAQTPKKEPKISPKKNWVEIWKSSLIQKDSNEKLSKNQIKAIDFTKGFLMRFFEEYVIPKEKCTTNTLLFARFLLRASLQDQVEALLPLLVCQKPKSIGTNEITLLSLLFSKVAVFFNSYSVTLQAIRQAIDDGKIPPSIKESRDKWEELHLKNIVNYRKQNSIFTPFEVSDNLLEIIYQKLLSLLRKVNLLQSLNEVNKKSKSRTTYEAGLNILIANVGIYLTELILSPQTYLHLLKRLTEESIFWDIGIEEESENAKVENTAIKALQAPLAKILKSIMPFGAPGYFFEKFLNFIMSSTDQWSYQASKGLIQEIHEILKSDSTSRPFIILNFLLFKHTNGKWEPAIHTSNETLEMKETTKNLIKMMENFVNDEIDKQNAATRLGLLALKNVTKSYCENCVAEGILLTQQPKIFTLLLWDVINGIESIYSLNSLKQLNLN